MKEINVALLINPLKKLMNSETGLWNLLINEWISELACLYWVYQSMDECQKEIAFMIW